MSSFLNSVLSTISDRSAQVVPPPVRAPANKTPVAATDSKNVPIRSSTQSQPSNGTSVSGKRKADEALNGHIDKAPRKDIQHQRPLSTPKVVSRPSDKLAKPEKPALSTSISTSTSKGFNTSSPVGSSQEPKVPKKGSYAEIMARMSQTPATIAPVGTIKHKPKEILSAKKELLLLKQERATKGKFRGTMNGKLSRSAPGSKSNSPGPSSRINGNAKPGKPEGKPDSKPPTYQGTMKPKPNVSYKGTLKPSSQPTSTAKKKDYNSDDPGRRKSLPVSRKVEPYRDYSDEESDEMGSFIEDDSDMEAGFTDVEEEEKKTLKLGKKEDKYEMMMEAELKRQKEAKKKRLAALQAKGL